VKISTKEAVFKQEYEKLSELFKDVEPAIAQLCEGLIQDASFLFAENHVLKQVLEKTGMVKIHPDNPSLQKPVEAAKQYLKNVNSYSVIIKTLNAILSKSALEEDDDDLGEFE